MLDVGYVFTWLWLVVAVFISVVYIWEAYIAESSVMTPGERIGGVVFLVFLLISSVLWILLTRFLRRRVHKW
jgi:hypothetical protein